MLLLQRIIYVVLIVGIFSDGFPQGSGGIFGTNGSPGGSSKAVSYGFLAASAFESGLSAVEELKLLKNKYRTCRASVKPDFFL